MSPLVQTCGLLCGQKSAGHECHVWPRQGLPREASLCPVHSRLVWEPGPRGHRDVTTRDDKAAAGSALRWVRPFTPVACCSLCGSAAWSQAESVLPLLSVSGPTRASAAALPTLESRELKPFLALFHLRASPGRLHTPACPRSWQGMWVACRSASSQLGASFREEHVEGSSFLHRERSGPPIAPDLLPTGQHLHPWEQAPSRLGAGRADRASLGMCGPSRGPVVLAG